MPTFKTGNMWSAWNDADLFLITTNSFVKTKTNELVMGAGIAKEAKDRFPNLPKQAGKIILKKCGFLGSYGLYVSTSWPKTKLGLFQVKFHWRDKASIDLIKRSLSDLDFWLMGRDDIQAHLNFPGIGNGRLDRDEILPLLQFLPKNVHIWELG